MNVPENHVVAEGRSLRSAIEAAAAELGVSAALVEHKIDLAHFRNASGASTGADTVRIFAWAKDPGDVAAAQAAEAWVKRLLQEMGRTGSVRAEQRGTSVTVHVDVGEGARHMVGRGGTTLRAIQTLMEQALHGEFTGVAFRIDIARSEDDRPRDDRPRRDDDRPRRDDDRPRRDDDRPRRDDRGERRRDDRPRRDDDRPRREGDRHRDDRPRRDDDRRDRRNDPEDLKRLARKLAMKVLETGEPETIRRELNSYDRRLVHIEVSEIEGVKSRSLGEGAERRVEIYATSEAEEVTEP